ncbi:plasmid recombination protein [Escherichia coli]|uniref:plasmid recombination protein n=1 Tax=Escherichia coli TaxID=562 RepID=UPI003FD41544
MSYQFIHIEDYSKVISKKRGNGGNGKYNEETKGRSVRDIIAEAKREEGNCPHVENPKPPLLLYGKNLDEVEKLAYEYHENTKLTDKNGKEKKLRSDANILLAGVVSLNRENEDIWDEYKNDAIAFLSNKYGKKLVSVIEHTDEANPHFHFYVIQDPGKRFDLIHDGKKALFENRDKKKHDQNIAYLNAMRKVQEDFFRVVSSNYGLSKDGPKRKRTSRKDYFKQKREIKLIQQVKEQAKIDGYNFAVDDFHGKSWLNKVVTSFTVKNRTLQEATARGDRYKKGLSSTKKKLKNTESDLEETEKELSSLKDNFKERVNNQTSLLKDKNNKLTVENENIKKQNEQLEHENKNLKTILEESLPLYELLKNKYGDRFEEWKESLFNTMKTKLKLK